MMFSKFSFVSYLPISYIRFITVLSILILNLLPVINGAPTGKSNHHLKLLRQKRQINVNDDDIIIDRSFVLPKKDIVFQGLLGLMEILIVENL